VEFYFCQFFYIYKEGVVAISKKLRFEVFKRDDFTCQYCGKKSPNVVLEADHIVPIFEGGNDEFKNLTTSCFDCNRGKGKELLESYREDTDPHDQAIFLLEKERQLKEYNKVVKKVRSREKKDINELNNYWDSTSLERKCRFPQSNIVYALKHLPKERIKSAIDICENSHIVQDGKSRWDSIKSYLFGILRNMINESKGI